MRPGSRLWRRVLLGLAVVWVAACQGSHSLYPTVEGPLSVGEGLKIGVILSVRQSNLSQSGESVLNGLYLLRDQVNRCHGVNQAPVSMIVEEAGGTTRSELDALQKLVGDYRVHGAIAYLGGRKPEQVIDMAKAQQVPLLIIADQALAIPPESDAAADAEKSDPFILHLAPSAYQRVDALAQLIQAQGHRQAIFVGFDHATQEDWLAAFVNTFEQRDGTVVNADAPLVWDRPPTLLLDPGQVTAPGDTFQTDLSRLLSQFPDAVLVVYNQPRYEQTSDGADFLQALLDLGWSNTDTPLYWASQPYFQTSLDEWYAAGLGDRAQWAGSTGVTPAAIGEGLLVFREFWQAHGNQAPTPETLYAWDAISALVLAAQSSGRNSAEQMVTSLATVISPPGQEVENVCEGLERLKANEPIDFQGASGNLDQQPAPAPERPFEVWRVSDKGVISIVDRLTLESP